MALKEAGDAVASPDGRTPYDLSGRSRGLTAWPCSALVTVLLAMALMRLYVAGAAGLTDDEAYYRLWALAPAMSYLDHPPMVGWMIAGGRWIAGDTALGIRLAAVLASLVVPVAVWRTAYLLFGPHVARQAVWIVLAMPLLAVGGVIMTPDTPSVLFWSLSLWALAELNASRNANWWLAIGVLAGLGLLSKYTNLFFGAAILLWLLVVPANRSWFRTWQLWAGGAIAGLLTLPVVLWNAQNGWASFTKQFGRVGHGRQLTATYVVEFAGAFLGLASPMIAVLALAGFWMVVRSMLTRRDEANTLIAAAILPLLAYFLIHALHDRVQANWVAPIYSALAICAAIALATAAGGQPERVRLLGRGAVAVGLALSGFIYLHALFPVTQIAGVRDPTSQMRGWRELAAEIERVRASTGACWIATSSYATTGQLAYALKDVASVVQLDERLRYLHLPPIAPPLLRCPALYVELERRSAPALLRERFRSVSFIGTAVRGHHGTTIARYAIHLAAEPFSDPLAATADRR